MIILGKEYNKSFGAILSDSYDYFESVGLKPMLTQHTLLGVHRNGGFLDRPNDCINLMCMAEDLTDDVVEMLKDSPFYCRINEGVLRRTNMYFDFRPKMRKQNYSSPSPTGVELLALYETKNKLMTNFSGNMLHLWSKDLSGYGKIDFMGKTYRTHKNIEGWLEEYYGKDWKIEDKKFHWTTAPKRLLLKDIEL